MKPGIYYDMPAEEYHAVDALGSSGLRKLMVSPLHYKGAYITPAEKKAATDAMRNGTLVHCLVLEPYYFADRYIALPDDAPRKPTEAQWNAKKPSEDSAKAMEWWSSFNEAAEGREIISNAEFFKALEQRDALMRLPEIQALLERGDSEVSAFWADKETGTRCKIRPDHVTPSPAGDVLIDVKTTRDASPKGFAKEIASHGYHIQAAYYCMGWEAATGVRPSGFVFAAVESEWPHAASAYILSDDDMEKGRTKVRELLNLYAQCKAADVWPGYPQTIQPIQLPAWT